MTTLTYTGLHMTALATLDFTAYSALHCTTLDCSDYTRLHCTTLDDSRLLWTTPTARYYNDYTELQRATLYFTAYTGLQLVFWNLDYFLIKSNGPLGRIRQPLPAPSHCVPCHSTPRRAMPRHVAPRRANPRHTG